MITKLSMVKRDTYCLSTITIVLFMLTTFGDDKALLNYKTLKGVGCKNYIILSRNCYTNMLKTKLRRVEGDGRLHFLRIKK